jgi:hypothetical protein
VPPTQLLVVHVWVSWFSRRKTPVCGRSPPRQRCEKAHGPRPRTLNRSPPVILRPAPPYSWIVPISRPAGQLVGGVALAGLGRMPTDHGPPLHQHASNPPDESSSCDGVDEAAVEVNDRRPDRLGGREWMLRGRRCRTRFGGAPLYRCTQPDGVSVSLPSALGVGWRVFQARQTLWPVAKGTSVDKS